ncbi:hypothetical protein VTN02DRAFT_3775 [Thermoascus thermophilus]
MRHSVLRLLLLAALLVLAAAWTKEDHEIFRLRDEIVASEGPDVTFYDFLGVKPHADYNDINKAYRKKSKLLHPDKVRRAFVANSFRDRSRSKSTKAGVHVSQGPSQREIAAKVKEAHERSARLNAVADILRSPARERYDYFLQNGFPKWKGTGYYYSRFRPGLGSVLVGLFLAFGGAAHYAALVLGWKRQRDFVDRYIRQARRAAWGDELGIRGIPGVDSVVGGATAPSPLSDGAADSGAVAMNRRQKRMMERESRKESRRGGKGGVSRGSGAATPTGEPAAAAPTGDRKRVVAENGKVLIVDSVGNVFLEEETEDGERQEFLLDIDEIQRPTIRDTMLFRFPAWCFRSTVGRLLGGSKKDDTVEIELESDDASHEEPPSDEANAAATTASSARATRKRGRRGQRS